MYVFTIDGNIFSTSCAIKPTSALLFDFQSNPSASSDIRLKENFESIGNALELVSQLNGTYYTWKKDAGADKPRKIGFIAQEVEKIIPELVKTDSEGMKAVDYVSFIPVLVEALKHQQKQIDELRALLHA